MKYVVIDSYGSVRYFEDAEAVAIFMWGKKLKNYIVYQKQDGLSSNVTKMQEQLEGRETS